MTAKQVLLAHVLERHRRGVSGVRSMTHDQLRKAHANAHFRYHPDHYHQAPGEVLGDPDHRPQGWYTGEDVVNKRQSPALSPSASWDQVEYDRVVKAAQSWDDERLALYLYQFAVEASERRAAFAPEVKVAILHEVADRVEAEALLRVKV